MLQSAYCGETVTKTRDRGFLHVKESEMVRKAIAAIRRRVEKHDLAIQRLRDQARSSAKTVKATAKALASADKARRDESEQSWTPIQRFIALIAALATLTTLYLALTRK